jgi:hypothetical protein
VPKRLIVIGVLGAVTATLVVGIVSAGAITVRLAVAGGTGKYRNARGVLIAQLSDNTTRLTYLLTP